MVLGSLSSVRNNKVGLEPLDALVSDTFLPWLLQLVVRDAQDRTASDEGDVTVATAGGAVVAGPLHRKAWCTE